MDIITLWSRVILPLTILIFVIYVIISSNKAAKELERKKTEENNQVDNKDSLPPFRDDVKEFPPETELAHQTTEINEADIPIVAEQAEVEPVQDPIPETKPVEPPPVPVDSRTPLPTKPVPVTSLIDLSPDTFRRGVILAEILGRPKGLRRRL